jgi:hypothetical protein
LLPVLLSSFGLRFFLLDTLLPVVQVVFDIADLLVQGASEQFVSELPERQDEGGNEEGFSFGLDDWHIQVGKKVRDSSLYWLVNSELMSSTHLRLTSRGLAAEYRSAVCTMRPNKLRKFSGHLSARQARLPSSGTKSSSLTRMLILVIMTLCFIMSVLIMP